MNKDIGKGLWGDTIKPKINANFLELQKSSGFIDITVFGIDNIETYVSRSTYTYIGEAKANTVPSEVNGNYYIGRLVLGQNSFPGFNLTISSSNIGYAVIRRNSNTWEYQTYETKDWRELLDTVCKNQRLFIPEGTFVNLGNFPTTPKEYFGDSKETSTIIYLGEELRGNIYFCKCCNLQLINISLNDYYINGDLVIDRCKFTLEESRGLSSSYLIMAFNKYNNNYINVYISNSVFEFYTLFSCIYIDRAAFVSIINNTITSKVSCSHPLRLNLIEKGAEIQYNTVSNGTTGIFFGSQRGLPTENIVISNNRIKGVKEESISFDGLGNNNVLCPVIANGTFTSSSKDSENNTVLVVSLKYVDTSGNVNQDCPISTYSNWTNFYLSANKNTGHDGKLFKIIAFNAINNTLTIDYKGSIAFTDNGSIGVQSGFFNVTIENNYIERSYGVGNQTFPVDYSVGISAYLNCFNFKINNNIINGCGKGLTVYGGKMLSTYNCLAWNVEVSNNKFYNILSEGVRIGTLWGNGTELQYNNKLVNNYIDSQSNYIDSQIDFIEEGNIAKGTVSYRYMPTQLPTASSAYLSRTFNVYTLNASGYAISINTYRCQLLNSVYTWVEI